MFRMTWKREGQQYPCQRLVNVIQLPTYAIPCFYGKSGRQKLVHVVIITTPDLNLHFSKAAVATPTKAHVSYHNAVLQSGMPPTKPAGSLGSASPRILTGVW